MSRFKLGNLTVVDLSKVLDPKTETRRCGLTRFNTGGPMPDFHTIIDLIGKQSICLVDNGKVDKRSC